MSFRDTASADPGLHVLTYRVWSEWEVAGAGILRAVLEPAFTGRHQGTVAGTQHVPAVSVLHESLEDLGIHFVTYALFVA